MSNNRFRKTVQEVAKECANTEKFLSKILKRQIPKPQGSCKHTSIKQNVSPERQNRSKAPLFTAPSSRHHSATARLKAGPSSPPPQHKHNHVHYHRSSSPMADVKSKPVSKDRQRTRSLSASSSLPKKPDGRGLRKMNETSKPTNAIDPQPSGKPGSQLNSVKRSDSKHLPWSEVLKDNKILWLDKSISLSQTAKPKPSAEKPPVSATCAMKPGFGPSERKKTTCGRIESSLSDGSSIFDTSAESGEHLVNKSVQCWLPASSTMKQTSTATISSSKLPEDTNTKSATDTLSIFDPVRTLNFLVRELHGFIRKRPEDRNLQRIITDMERALHRIPYDVHGDSTSARDKETLVMPLVLKVDSSLLSATTKTSDTVVKQLEDSCMKLEAMCQEMESTNKELRQQRDHFQKEVQGKNQEIEGLQIKIKDYLEAITTLRSNVETTSKAQTDLNMITSQLKEEIKNLRETESKLKQEMQDMKQANEGLEKEKRMLLLEKEKLLVLNQSKDRELENFKKELTDIKTEVASHLTEFRAQVEEIRQHNFTDLDVSNDTTEPESVTSEAISPRRPVCSSPNSSKGSIPKVDPSWQMISSIPPEHSVITWSPEKQNLSFKSMEGDVSDLDETLSNQPTVIPMHSKEGELKSLFDEMRKQTKLSSTNISIPSPPQPFNVTEPEGVSQFSGNSSFNSSSLITISELDSKTESVIV